MTPGSEQLDRLEPVPGNLREMSTLEPASVVEVRGDSEAHALPAGFSG
jgi:hypothetical protein